MANEKKFTAKQVATFVLSKVSEILSKSESIEKKEKEDRYSEDSLNPIAGNRTKRAANYKKKGDKVSYNIAVEGAKESHEDRLNAIRSAPTPALKSENIEKKEKEDRYVVDTKKRDKYGRVTIYDKKREIEFKAKLKEGDSMEKSQNALAINPKLLSQDPTHTYKGEKVKSVKQTQSKNGIEHVVEYMEGEHKGKWTQAHENDLEPIKKEESCSSCGKMHKKETKFDRCVEHVTEQSPEVKSPEAVCVSQGVRPEKWGKSQKLNKADRENDFPSHEDLMKKPWEDHVNKHNHHDQKSETQNFDLNSYHNTMKDLYSHYAEATNPNNSPKERSEAEKTAKDMHTAAGIEHETTKENYPEEFGKSETENSKKLGYKLSEAGKKEVSAEESDKAFEVKGKESKSSDDARLSDQQNPEKNPKEQAEGNNELAGTTPTQVGEDGKNKPGFSEMRSDLKLAKWLGRMEEKRKSKSQNIEKSENFDEELSKAEEFESLMKMAAIWEKRAHDPDLGHYAETKGLPFTFEHAKNMPKEKHLELEQKALKHVENAEKEGHHHNADYHKKKAAYHKLWAEAKQSPWHYEDREKDLKDTHDSLHSFWKGKAKEKKSSKKAPAAETVKTKEAPVSATTATTTAVGPSKTIPKTKSVKQSSESSLLGKSLKLSEEIESPTLVKSAEAISGMHKVEYYTYQELDKSEDLEKADVRESINPAALRSGSAKTLHWGGSKHTAGISKVGALIRQGDVEGAKKYIKGDKELNKSSETEKKKRTVEDIKAAHSRVKSQKVDRAKKELEEFNREIKGIDDSQQKNIKGVYTKPGVNLLKEPKKNVEGSSNEKTKNLEEEAKEKALQRISQDVERQRVAQEAKEINPKLVRSEKDSHIRELQKSGLSPEQILKRLKKEEECEKEGKRMLTKAEIDNQIRELQKSGLSPQQIMSKLKKEESVPKEAGSSVDLKALREKHKEKVAEWEKKGANPKDIDSMVYLHDEIEKKKKGQ